MLIKLTIYEEHPLRGHPAGGADKRLGLVRYISIFIFIFKYFYIYI